MKKLAILIIACTSIIILSNNYSLIKTEKSEKISYLNNRIGSLSELICEERRRLGTRRWLRHRSMP